MKRNLWILAVALLVAGPALAGIANTDHDLRGDITTNQICLPCHTPHNASPAVPLWNHTLSANTFTAYTSPTLDNPTANWAGTDGSISALCMSCHDGSVALGAVINDPTGDIQDTTSTIGTGNANLGTDLSNDHPVNFAVTDGSDAEIRLIADMVTGGTPFFGAGANEMQCGSCHDPHNDTNDPFLVIANTGSALCLNCHIK